MWLLFFFSQVEAFVCNTEVCNLESWRGLTTGACPLECNTLVCGFLEYPIKTSPCLHMCVGPCNHALLGNGICDETCNFLECGFDGGDCAACTPGCTIEMLGNGVCDAPCDNSMCTYDQGDCSLCSQDCPKELLSNKQCDAECNNEMCRFDGGDCPVVDICLPSMIDNGICEYVCNIQEMQWDGEDCDCAPLCSSKKLWSTKCFPECNNEACNFQSGTCVSLTQIECAPGCTRAMAQEINVCHPECNVMACGFDLDCKCTAECAVWGCYRDCLILKCEYGREWGCQDEFLIEWTLNAQKIHKYYNSKFLTEECVSPCNEAMLRDAWDNKKCVEECNSQECAYVFGLCQNVLHPKCEVGFGDGEDQCFKCAAPYLLYFTTCLDACPEGFAVRTLVERLCLPTIDDNIEAPLNQLFVFQEFNRGVINEGSLYFDLNDALAALHQVSSVINLLGDAITFNPAATLSRTNSDYLQFSQLPDLFTDALWTNLTIQSLTCAMGGNPAVMQFCSETRTTLYFASVQRISLRGKCLKLLNLELTTRNYFQHYSPKYCPYIQWLSEYYADDRGKMTRPIHLGYFLCSEFEEISLFIVNAGSMLWMKVRINQDVEISDVTIQLLSVVEIQGGDVLLQNVNFTNVQPSMRENFNGVITQSVGCYIIETCGSFVYQGGKVSYMNNGFELLNTTYLNPFLSFQLVTRIEVSKVKFEYCAMSLPNKGLFSLVNFMSLTISECEFANNFVKVSLLFINSYTRLAAAAIDQTAMQEATHIKITSSKFTNNFSLNSLIQIRLQGDLLNVEISACTFTANVQVSGYVIELLYFGILTAANIAADSEAHKALNIANTTFELQSSFPALLSVTNFANVRLSDLIISRNGELEGTSLEEAQRCYIGAPGIYASKVPYRGAPCSCSSMIQMTQVVNVEMKHSSITRNRCSLGGTGLSLTQASGLLSVIDMYFAENEGALGSGLALTIGRGSFLSVLSIVALRNRHSDSGLILVGPQASLHIRESLFEGNQGYSGACVYADGAQSVKISNSSFVENEVALGSGGVLYFVPGAAESSELLIEGSAFRGNRAKLGGAVFVSLPLYSAPTKIRILECEFTADLATIAGASLYLSETVELIEGSMIQNCTLQGGNSPGGAIALMHSAGTLAITESVFRENTGRLASGVYIQSAFEARTELKQVTFVGNRDAPALGKPNSRICSVFSTDTCTFQNNEGMAISLENGSWTDRNSSFIVSQNRSAELMQQAHAELTDTTFESNNSPTEGGALHLSSQSVARCSNCSFLNNTAGTVGGAIFAEQKSTLILVSCRFGENSAGDSGAAIYLLSAAPCYISLCEFSSNVVRSSGVITALSTVLYLNTSSVHENVGERAPGLSLKSSTATVSDCSFTAQRGSESAFLSVLSSSQVAVLRCSFSHGNRAVYINSSNLTVVQSTVSEISTQKGGAISAESLSFVDLWGVEMTNVTSDKRGSALDVSGSALRMHSARLHGYSYGAVFGSDLSALEIVSSEFGRGTGGAVYCVQCATVLLANSSFTEQQGESAVHVGISDLVTVLSCVFANNTAPSGGALTAANLRLSVANSTFFGNVASSGDGGALFLDCSQPSLCEFNISGSEFERNRAVQSGGAIRWKATEPKLVQLRWKENKASYGSDIASFAVQLNVSISSEFIVSDTNPVRIADVPPGQPLSIAILARLLDHYGSVVTIENAMTAQLTSSNVSVLISGVSKVTAEHGEFTFDNFMIYADPGLPASLQLSTSAAAEAVTIVFEMRKCRAGESATPTSCMLCGPGMYSFDPTLPCQICPMNAECLGNVTLVPQPGFWKAKQHSSTIHPCLNIAACLGGHIGSQVNLLGFCAEGYQGNLCQSCSPSFFRSAKNSCKDCPEFSMNMLQGVLISVGLLVFLAVLVWSAMNSARQTVAVHSVYLKILLNYLQVTYLISEFDLKLPSEVVDSLSPQEKVGGASESVFSVECLIGGNSTADMYFRKMVYLVVLPVVLFSCAGVLWGAIALIQRSFTELRQNFISTIVIIFFFVHPTLVKAFFSMFSCHEIDQNEYWLSEDLSAKCWDFTHIFYVYTVALPGVILWVLGVPLLCLLMLVRSRKHLQEYWMRQRFGFLTDGYIRQRYYWEFVILFRKVAIICCSSFLNSVEIIQALIVQLIMLLYAFLLYEERPFTTAIMNRIDLCSLLALNITLYCGLFYLSDQLSVVSSWFFLTVIVLVNFAFFIYWLYEIMDHIFKKQSQRRLALAQNEFVGEFEIRCTKPQIASAFGRYSLNPMQDVYRCMCLTQRLFDRVPTSYRLKGRYSKIVRKRKDKYSRVAPLNLSEEELLPQGISSLELPSRVPRPNRLI